MEVVGATVVGPMLGSSRESALRAAAVFVAAILLTACNKATSPPTTPPAASEPAVVSLIITGLPAPLLFDIPPAVAAGRQYPLGVVATRSDGAQAEVKPETITWTSADTSVASFSGNALSGHRDGATSITASVGRVSASRDLSVYVSGVGRVERADRITCDIPQPAACSYPACPKGGPFWLFPVHETGVVELVDVKNPGWGSPSNYVVQLSPEGKAVWAWLLLPTNSQYRSALVPGGYMYAFTMQADVGPCGDVSAVWTHPK